MNIQEIKEQDLEKAFQIYQDCFQVKRKEHNLKITTPLLGLYQNENLIGICQINFINNIFENERIAYINSFGIIFMRCLDAFTLAEVLVTLGIIGVVSAMTVPTLMQNYQRQSYVTQLHKTYNEMSQALLRYQTDKNAINLTEAGMTSQDAVNDFIKTYFKTVQECGTVNSCFASSYKTLSGETLPTYYFTMQNVKAYVLANGVSVRPGYNTDECAASNGVRIVAVAIDINGKKGPNIGGRDLFWMYFYNNGLIDDKPNDLVSNAPLTTEQREASFNKRCDTVSGSPDGCMGKIINDGWQMNY